MRLSQLAVQRSRRRCLVLATLLLHLLAGTLAATAEAPRPAEKRILFAQQSPRAPSRRENQLLVSLANGNLVALDKETGETLWTFETGAPLVSSTPVTVAGAGDGESEADLEAAAARLKDTIFPGTDGSLYAYRQSQGDEPPRIEKLPVSVSELVNEAPAPTLDGSLVMGSQHTTVFLIDGASGELIRTFYDFDGELGQLSNPATLGLPEDTHIDLANAVVIGRKDYVLRSVHPQFGEQWNVTWSQIQRLSELEVVRPVPMLPRGGSSSSGGADAPEGAPEGALVAAGPEEEGGASAGGLVVGPDFSLRQFDPTSGWEQWAHKFDAVPIAAYSAAGGRTDLLAASQRQQQQATLDAPVPAGAQEQGGRQGQRRGLPLPKILAQVWQGGSTPGQAAAAQGQGSAEAASSRGSSGPGICTFGGHDEVLVGLMGGGLFGVPASHLTFDVTQQCQDDGEYSGAGDAVNPPLPPETASQEPATAGVPSSALAVAQPKGGAGVQGGDAVCRSDDPSGQCTMPLGMYKLHKPPTAAERSRLLLLPASANELRERAAKAAAATAAAAAAVGAGRAGAGLTFHVWAWVAMLLVGAAGASVAVLAVLRSHTVPAQPDHLLRQLEMVAGDGQPLLGGAEQADRRRADGASSDAEGSAKSKWKRKGGPLKGKNMSNQMKGALMQQITAEREGASGAGGSRGGGGSGSSAASRGAMEGAEAGSSGILGQEGQLGRMDSEAPSSAAVQDGMQSSGGRREVRDGKVFVGRMQIGPGILGYGSGGTVVFEGEMDGRPVAVKRLLRQFYDLARKEIGALILSDEHPNIVRVFGLEEDHEFCYLALERCQGTLSEAMQVPSVHGKFVDEQGRPTALAMRVAEDVGRGLEALHARDIVHRDLKPHNVLLTESGRAKISDMGLSKRLVPEQASFESVGSGGSSGWQAPEQLLSRSGGSARQTRSVDVFSYGLLVHYSLTGGAHPFGESYERDANILMGRMNLKHLAQQPLAADLLRGMLAAAPGARPSVASVMAHPLWWDTHRRLAFLIDVSDRVEGEDRAEDQRLYQSLETLVEDAVGPTRSWAAVLDSGLVNNLGKYRRYSYSSLRDLLRVIRNKHNHFRELPPELQRKVGPVPEGFLDYFTSRYPGLLATCFYFALRWCAEEPVFHKYFTPASKELLEVLGPRALRSAADAQQAEQAQQQKEQTPGQQQQKGREKEDAGSRPGSAGGEHRAAASTPQKEGGSRPGSADGQQGPASVQKENSRPGSPAGQQQVQAQAQQQQQQEQQQQQKEGSRLGSGGGGTPRVEKKQAGDGRGGGNEGLRTVTISPPQQRPLASPLMTPQQQQRREGSEGPVLAASSIAARPLFGTPEVFSMAAPAPQDAKGAAQHLAPKALPAPPAPPVSPFKGNSPPGWSPLGSPAAVHHGSDTSSPPAAAANPASGLAVGPAQVAADLSGSPTALRRISVQRISDATGPSSGVAASPAAAPAIGTGLALHAGGNGGGGGGGGAATIPEEEEAHDLREPSWQGLPVDLSGMLGSELSGEFPNTPSILSPLGHNLPASPLIGGTPKLPPSPLIGGTPKLPPSPLIGGMPKNFFRPVNSSMMGPELGYGLPHGAVADPQQPGATPPSLLFGAGGGLPHPASSGFPRPAALATLRTPQLPQQPAATAAAGTPALAPPPRRRGPPRPMEPQLPEHDISPVGIVEQMDGRIALFPQRPGQPVCDFFMKTGHCRFGESCKYHHPTEYCVKLNKDGLPLRPGEPLCSFYERFGECRFGPSCKYDHGKTFANNR